MNKLIFVECPINGGPDGVYLQVDKENKKIYIVACENMNDKALIIHEITHHLWNIRNKELQKALKRIGLNFNSNLKDLRKNKIIGQYVNINAVRNDYPENDVVEECICYFMGSLTLKELKILNISYFNNIINNNFEYINFNADIIYNGEVIRHDEKAREFIRYVTLYRYDSNE